MTSAVDKNKQVFEAFKAALAEKLAEAPPSTVREWRKLPATERLAKIQQTVALAAEQTQQDDGPPKQGEQTATEEQLAQTLRDTLAAGDVDEEVLAALATDPELREYLATRIVELAQQSQEVTS